MTVETYFEQGADQTQTVTIPAGCTAIEANLRGAGGAGDFGRGGKGGGGGGRGAMGLFRARGTLGGKVIVLVTGKGGYAPTAQNFGNVGTHTTLTFDNGYQWIGGGGQRAEYDRGAQSGNCGEYGTIPSFIVQTGQVNGGADAGQHALGTKGGLGGGKGDVGFGGDGGDSNAVGMAGNGGYIHIKFSFN